MSKVKDYAKSKQFYSIGEVAKICNVSRKTLRFYEQLGLVHPDYVCSENGYRYYTEQTMNLIPVIKYYKQMGFKLQEMGNVQNTGDYFYQENNFLTKLDELKLEEQRIRNSHTAVADWIGLLREGSMAIENQLHEVSIKYLDQERYVFLDQQFNYNYMDAIINIPWVNYLEENSCEITGPVILYFDNCTKKMEQTSQTVRIMQKPVGVISRELPLTSLGGQMYLSSYYIGDLEHIGEQYTKMKTWADIHGYKYQNKAYERYVIDYWSTMNVNNFVVEILIPAEKIRK